MNGVERVGGSEASMGSGATIRRITAWEVVVPTKPGAVNSPEYGTFIGGHDWDRMPICLIEAEMADGLTGLGETGRGVPLSSLEPWLKQLPGRSLRPFSAAGLPEGWQGVSMYG